MLLTFCALSLLSHHEETLTTSHLHRRTIRAGGGAWGEPCHVVNFTNASVTPYPQHAANSWRLTTTSCADTISSRLVGLRKPKHRELN